MIDSKRYLIENSENWRDAVSKMPKLKFPSDWDVTIIPPFGGAMARFTVDLPCGTHKSIYADFHYALGYYGPINSEKPTPYWEVYPVHGDVGRCDIDDTEELMRMIADTTEITE